MLLTFVYLLAALLVLARAAEYSIDKAVIVARYLRIGEMAVGFLLVSVATSLPEFVVSVTASANGETGISVGNVLGANISDMCMVVGAAALAGAMAIRRNAVLDLVKALFAVAVLSIVVVVFPLGRFAGLLLLLVFALYAFLLLKKRAPERMDGGRVSGKEALKAGAIFAASIAVVVFASNFVINSAVSLAGALGVSQTLIAGTLISIGTTLPELAVSVAAARRRHVGLAMGNAVGSCITNLTLVLGAAAIITPISTAASSFFVLAIFSLIANAALWFMLLRGKIGKKEGAVLIGIYLLFLASAVLSEIQ
ncbi:Sodium/calcium exchanger MaX1 [Candidatus Norongarragalina meridionalis]|nr:Sodium/calcium exchanger MaX1 [Candidatus Norongarragalina meridionalis]